MTESKPSLTTITERPYNAETPLFALMEDRTPTELVYVRNHFDVPEIDSGAWLLTVTGAVNAPRKWGLDDLKSLAAGETKMTLECAGNGRSGMHPAPVGTPWGFGAISFIETSGTPLINILQDAGVNPEAVEVLFIGADQGEVYAGRTEVFARSLPLAEALNPDVLLVWAMNGEPLTPDHGYPLRLIVPDWYGMASVKWLKEIRVITEPFKGFFQAEHYVYQEDEIEPDGTPVGKIRTRSLITSPTEGQRLGQEAVEVRGVAWSGEGSVEQVLLSSDGGKTWQEAVLDPPSSNFGGQEWRLNWEPKTSGTHVLLSRAVDSNGNQQPVDHLWNKLGYGNNGIRPVQVQVV